MKKLLTVALALCALLMTSAFAQTDAAQAKKSDEILHKMREIDMLNYFVPLVMTKEQIRKLLPTVEKIRQKVKAVEKKEYDMLVSVEAEIDKTLKSGYEAGDVPDRELLQKLSNLFMAFRITRESVAEENIDLTIKALKETLNAGQLKAAMNTLKPNLFDPALKPEEMTEDQKLRFFVGQVFLDPVAYDVLVKMSK